MIDEKVEPVDPTPVSETEPEPVRERTKSPWKAFVLTGFLASLVGAAGGGYGVYEGLKRFSPEPIEQSKVDLSPLESKINNLTDRLTRAEASVKKTAARPAAKAEPVDLSGLENRLDAIESAPKAEIDPEALAALQSAQKDGFEWPDTSGLENRLIALETKLDIATESSASSDIDERLQALETQAETSQSETELSAVDVERWDDLEARMAALENRPLMSNQAKAVTILAFPKTALVAAAEDNMEGGFMKKALSKHVRVKDEDAPLTLIDGIEADIAKGRFEAAAKKYERLPEPIRAAGQAWYESVKASL